MKIVEGNGTKCHIGTSHSFCGLCQNLVGILLSSQSGKCMSLSCPLHTLHSAVANIILATT